jgi:hypothetical protein
MGVVIPQNTFPKTLSPYFEENSVRVLLGLVVPSTYLPMGHAWRSVPARCMLVGCTSAFLRIAGYVPRSETNISLIDWEFLDVAGAASACEVAGCF